MSTEQSIILVVDDEVSIRRVLCMTLSNLGFRTVEAARGEEAVSLVRTAKFHAVLLDVNMPGIGGIEACKQIRIASPRLPIIMLTIRDSEDDKVEALDAGADDYVAKPFQLRELTARIRAAVRRTHVEEQDSDQLMRIGDILLDPGRRLVQKAGRNIHLTPKEFELLRFLMSHAGQPITHAQLLKAVWGPEYGSELEYLRTFMRQIRKKIEDDHSHPRYLLTESHIGYRFAESVSGDPGS